MRIRLILVRTIVLLCTAALILAQNGNELYQQGLLKEADGDIRAAIQIYERIVKSFSSNHELAAKALLRLGASSERLGQANARQYYEQIVKNYPDQAEMAAEARKHLAPAAATRVEVKTPYTDDPLGFAISPDGRSLVYQAITDGKSQLWLRQLDTGKTMPLPGTTTFPRGFQSGGSLPFWSPDGRSIGFFADAKLKRIDIATGVVKTLADAPVPRGGTWNSDGVIVYSPFRLGGLYRIPAGGGEPAKATRTREVAETNPSGHRRPQFLPDGRRFLLHALPNGTISVGSLDSLEVRNIGTDISAAAFSLPDYLVFVVSGALWAQHQEIQGLTPVGDSVRLADRVESLLGAGGHALSVSAVGSVAYRSDINPERQLLWYDRTGKQVRSVGPPNKDGYCCIRLSPDGRTVAFGTDSSSNSGARVMDLDGKIQRIAVGDTPIWSPDGRRIAFGSQQSGWSNLFQVEPGGRAVRLLETLETKFPNDWSSEGYLLYQRLSGTTGSDLMALPLRDASPAGDPIVVADTGADERNGRFSPDGRWVAYESTDGNGYDVYVQPFRGSASSRRRISVNGGTNPQWGRDGRELYFLSADCHLMVVNIVISTDAPDINIGKPVPLFAAALRAGSEYAATSDGERFLIYAPTGEAPPIIVLSNWAGRK